MGLEASSDVKGTRRTFNPDPSARMDEVVMEGRRSCIVDIVPVPARRPRPEISIQRSRCLHPSRSPA
jgi:hypothetical protein